MSQPIEIAVDTNVLIDLANNEEIILDCFSVLDQRLPKHVVVVLPTVIQELADLADSGSERDKSLAIKALQSIRSPWGFHPINCIPVGHAIVERTGQKLRDQGLIPENECNDSFVVAEAALREVSILLSSDHHIKDIDQRSLKLALDACDVGCPLIASPWKIVHDFFLKKD